MIKTFLDSRRAAIGGLALVLGMMACAPDPEPLSSTTGGGSSGTGGDATTTTSGETTGTSGGTCVPGAIEPCYSGPVNTQGIGVCAGGQQTCNNDGSGFGPCIGEVTPVAESCATPGDDDCNGTANDGCVFASCQDVKITHPNAASGVYTIDVDSAGPEPPFQAYCEMEAQGGGWTLLMKATGIDYPYDSQHWDSPTVDNEMSLDETLVSAKYASFNVMPVNELFIKAASGNQTVLALPGPGTMLAYFQGSTTVLGVVAGKQTPGELINNNAWAYCGPAWRLNTQFVNNTIAIRLGGWAIQYWSCEPYYDATGYTMSRHLLGFGLMDDNWLPNAYGRKSFGIREGLDGNHMNPGQLASAALLFGR